MLQRKQKSSATTHFQKVMDGAERNKELILKNETGNHRSTEISPEGDVKRKYKINTKYKSGN